MTRLRMLCLLLVFVLFASACGGSDATGVAASSASETIDPTAEPETAGNSGSADDGAGTDEDDATPAIESDSPIENLLGVPVFDDAAMTTLFTDLSREAEVAVATCMLAQGFDYTPALIGEAGLSGELDTDSLRYAQERGLGIVVDFNEAEFNPATASTSNNDYVEALSDGERDAYFIALTGNAQPDDIGPDGERGCAGQAEEEVFSILRMFDVIEDDLDRYYDLFISDSRIIAITTQWQECMAADGFLFENDNDMYEKVIAQIEAVMSDEANFAEFDGEALAASGSFFGGGFRPPLVPRAQAIIDDLGEEEKLIAIANWTCREPIKDIELEVQREYESQFVDEIGPQVRAIQGDN